MNVDPSNQRVMSLVDRQNLVLLSVPLINWDEKVFHAQSGSTKTSSLEANARHRIGRIYGMKEPREIVLSKFCSILVRAIFYALPNVSYPNHSAAIVPLQGHRDVVRQLNFDGNG